MRISSIVAHAPKARPMFKGNLTQAEEQRLAYLRGKHDAFQYATEGCNGCGLSVVEQAEIDYLSGVQKGVIEKPVPGNIYGVPNHDFFGASWFY